MGAPNAAGAWFLLAGAERWHAKAEAAEGQRLAVATGLRMALPTSGQAVEVAHVAPDVARVTAAHKELGRQYPRPHRLTAAAMDATFVEAVEQNSQGSAGRSSARGRGGGGRFAFDIATSYPI